MKVLLWPSLDPGRDLKKAVQRQHLQGSEMLAHSFTVSDRGSEGTHRSLNKRDKWISDDPLLLHFQPLCCCHERKNTPDADVHKLQPV